MQIACDMCDVNLFLDCGIRKHMKVSHRVDVTYLNECGEFLDLVNENDKTKSICGTFVLNLLQPAHLNIQ